MDKGKKVLLTAKSDCSIYYSDELCGYSYFTKRLVKGQTIILILHSTYDVENMVLRSILGNKNIAFMDGTKYVSAYSNDILLSQIK